jgi:hypothetical protein
MGRKSTWASRVALALVLLCGCKRELTPPPGPEQACQALVAALDAWKGEEQPADLQARDPAMHVADMDWQRGWKLQSFQLLPGQEERGASMLVAAALSLRDPRGEVVNKIVAYLIGTRPVITIIREDDD